jgi:LuxR family maltose regulon positive regulatory protein
VGNCHRFQGEVREAEEHYAEALATARALDSPFLVQAVTNRAGQNQFLQGRLRQAARTFEAALERAEERGGELVWFAGELHAHLGRIYTEWDDLGGALRQVRRAIELSQRAENQLALLEGYLALAGVRAARGQANARDQALDRAQQLAREARVPYLERQVAAQRAWLGLWAGGGGVPGGEVGQWAEAWAARRAQGQEEEVPPILGEFQDLILARFWLGRGRLDEAQGLLAEIQPAAQVEGRMGTVLQAVVLRALAFQLQGKQVEARDTVERALALAEPEGYVRTFVDAGEPLRWLLAEFRSRTAASHGKSDALAAYVDRLLAAFPGAATPRSKIRDLLTPRELEILVLMARGASNQAIAERLVVTVGTVKGHVNHILDKLEAHNRTEAVARARELGLLEH